MNVAVSFCIVPSILPGGIVGDTTLVRDATRVGDATWDALSSSFSCFEPFIVILFVACNQAMVNVFVLSSVFTFGSDKLIN